MEGKSTISSLYKCINEKKKKICSFIDLWVFNCFRFAAALKDQKVWIMNVVNVDAPDTLPIIFERGLFGMYHDWCESFSTYPRTYDLLHADRLFSKIRDRYKR
jgi:Putative S-adenosyl-L-methionine-dependent methyltransferase